MLPLIGFFIAGFFAPVWPWGLLAAALLQAFALWLGRREQLAMWWQRSPALTLRLIAAQLASATALHGAVMLTANLIRWQLGGAPPF